MADHYEVLQVHPRAESEVIRAAYRVLARKHHPDHGGDPKRMIALNDAWDVLGDPIRRAEYDASRVAPGAARDAVAAAPAAPPAPADPTAPRAPDATHVGPPPGRPSGTVLNFGRYAGWSLGEIARYDIDYLEWLQRATVGRQLRAELDAILRPRRGAGPSSSHGLPRR